jgi:hypothetical protein
VEWNPPATLTNNQRLRKPAAEHRAGSNPKGILAQSPRLPPRGYLGAMPHQACQPQRGFGDFISRLPTLDFYLNFILLPTQASHLLFQKSSNSKSQPKDF